MVIESDTDRDGLMIDSGETLTHSGTDYTVLAAETDGETLDAAPGDVDGMIEVMMKETDITAGSIAEGDAATYAGDTYRVQKIDHIGDGLSVVYLDP